MHYRSLSFIVLLAIGGRLSAEEFEQVLVPLYVPTTQAGAYGSAWSTELSVWNTGMQPLTIFQSACAYDCTCLIPTSCTPGKPTLPNQRFSGELFPNDSFGVVPAIFLYATQSGASDLAMSLRVGEHSRNDHAGVEIPLVRERDVQTGTLWLVNIPASAHFRQHLRVYFLRSPSGSGAVRVRVFRDDDEQPALEQVLVATPPLFEGRVPPEGDFNAPAPGYAFWPLPDVALGAPALRLEITSLTMGLKFWAMVSVTHNESQHVTLVTPQ